MPEQYKQKMLISSNFAAIWNMIGTSSSKSLYPCICVLSLSWDRIVYSFMTSKVIVKVAWDYFPTELIGQSMSPLIIYHIKIRIYINNTTRFYCILHEYIMIDWYWDCFLKYIRNGNQFDTHHLWMCAQVVRL